VAGFDGDGLEAFDGFSMTIRAFGSSGSGRASISLCSCSRVGMGPFYRSIEVAILEVVIQVRLQRIVRPALDRGYASLTCLVRCLACRAAMSRGRAGVKDRAGQRANQGACRSACSCVFCSCLPLVAMGLCRGCYGALSGFALDKLSVVGVCWSVPRLLWVWGWLWWRFGHSIFVWGLAFLAGFDLMGSF
jgi:hypothetical protein